MRGTSLSLDLELHGIAPYSFQALRLTLVPCQMPKLSPPSDKHQISLAIDNVNSIIRKKERKKEQKPHLLHFQANSECHTPSSAKPSTNHGGESIIKQSISKVVTSRNESKEKELTLRRRYAFPEWNFPKQDLGIEIS